METLIISAAYLIVAIFAFAIVSAIIAEIVSFVGAKSKIQTRFKSMVHKANHGIQVWNEKASASQAHSHSRSLRLAGKA